MSSSYVRAKLPDGTFKPEPYAFAEGGRWLTGVYDPSIDKLKFMDVARTIAASLADRNFIPARDPKATKLLIVVYWGRTATPGRTEESQAVQNMQNATEPVAAAKSAQQQQDTSAANQLTVRGTMMACGHFVDDNNVSQVADQIDSDNALTSALAVVAAENHNRDQLDAQNAAMLGYGDWLNANTAVRGTPLEHRRDDMINELEHDRYFVILMAYDFQSMWKEKKHTLLWETRFSVPQRGFDFDKQLSLLALNASRYFGQDSHGLVHMDLPEGHVDVGELKSLGPVAAR